MATTQKIEKYSVETGIHETAAAAGTVGRDARARGARAGRAARRTAARLAKGLAGAVGIKKSTKCDAHNKDDGNVKEKCDQDVFCSWVPTEDIKKDTKVIWYEEDDDNDDRIFYAGDVAAVVDMGPDSENKLTITIKTPQPGADEPTEVDKYLSEVFVNDMVEGQCQDRADARIWMRKINNLFKSDYSKAKALNRILNHFSEREKLQHVIREHELTNMSQYKGHTREERIVILQYILGSIRRTLEGYMMNIATDCVEVLKKPRGKLNVRKSLEKTEAMCKRNGNFNLFYDIYQRINKMYPMKNVDGNFALKTTRSRAININPRKESENMKIGMKVEIFDNEGGLWNRAELVDGPTLEGGKVYFNILKEDRPAGEAPTKVFLGDIRIVQAGGTRTAAHKEKDKCKPRGEGACKEGDRVKVFVKKDAMWYPGTVSKRKYPDGRDSGDPTYSVLRDDGETEGGSDANLMSSTILKSYTVAGDKLSKPHRPRIALDHAAPKGTKVTNEGKTITLGEGVKEGEDFAYLFYDGNEGGARIPPPSEVDTALTTARATWEEKAAAAPARVLRQLLAKEVADAAAGAPADAAADAGPTACPTPRAEELNIPETKGEEEKPPLPSTVFATNLVTSESPLPRPHFPNWSFIKFTNMPGKIYKLAYNDTTHENADLYSVDMADGKNFKKAEGDQGPKLQNPTLANVHYSDAFYFIAEPVLVWDDGKWRRGSVTGHDCGDVKLRKYTVTIPADGDEFHDVPDESAQVFAARGGARENITTSNVNLRGVALANTGESPTNNRYDFERQWVAPFAPRKVTDVDNRKGKPAFELQGRFKRSENNLAFLKNEVTGFETWTKRMLLKYVRNMVKEQGIKDIRKLYMYPGGPGERAPAADDELVPGSSSPKSHRRPMGQNT